MGKNIKMNNPCFKELIISPKRFRCRKMKKTVIFITKVIIDVRMLCTGHYRSVRSSGPGQTRRKIIYKAAHTIVLSHSQSKNKCLEIELALRSESLKGEILH